MRRLEAGAFFSKIPQAFAPICNIFKLPPGTDLLQPIFWPLFALLLNGILKTLHSKSRTLAEIWLQKLENRRMPVLSIAKTI